MTKQKIKLLVNKSLNLFAKKARSLKLGSKLWNYTWVSIATAKKRKYKTPNRIKHLDTFIDSVVERLNHKRSIHINNTYSCGANYKCIVTGKKHTDWINIPCIKRFKNRNNYYKTIFHELCHCIMDRLAITDRIDNNEDEEITAELCSMILSTILGVNSWRESYKYIGDYLLNSGGFIIHEGRRNYIKKSSIRLLEYLLKLQ